MFSEAFIKYQENFQAGPPMSPDAPSLPGTFAPQGGTPIPEEFAHLKVPMMPPDYVAPGPEIPEGFEGGKVTVGGVTGLHMTRAGVREKAAFLYIHGGGFTIGSGMIAAPLLSHIIESTGLECYSVEYSLAPYAKFPVAINECVAFYKGLLDSGFERIIVGGESAGAGLTLSLVHALKMEKLPLPYAIWCSSPVDNIRYDKEEVFLHDMFLDSTGDILEAYVGDADPKDPRISPIYGDFSGFPPTFIQSGSAESLSAGALRLVDKLVRAGNEVHFTFGKGMPHTFAMDYESYPEANNAMNEILTFMNNVLNLK